ncbi:MAG: NAD-dependent epimerase/dehydratase family protein [Bradyrhizobium sp.]|nr:MAG: NAD-dependent epimerase/dehydratase family protein [Bradyrhizobium sp.]
MDGAIGVFGFGPVGAATIALLSGQGRPLRLAQRSAPATLPAGVEFRRCDALDADSVASAVDGLAQAVLSIGLPYTGEVWRDAWPRIMTNFVEACARTGARLVFFDNLYMYGPQTTPLLETTALQPFGVKPAARVAATRIWQAASDAGRLKVAAIRAADFYGPGVTNSHLGDTAFGALARGGRATVIGSPDTPHDFAYAPDCARAVVSLLDAPDDAYGQAWHVPNAPIRTPRKILALGVAALGMTAPRVVGLPPALLRPLGLFVPALRELAEMRFQWDRPYRVDASRFAARFWSDATPFEVGAPATALWFRDRVGRPSG